MTFSIYQRKLHKPGDYPCIYRINDNLRMVQYSTNNGISWHKSCISIPQFYNLIRDEHMVEVELV